MPQVVVGAGLAVGATAAAGGLGMLAGTSLAVFQLGTSLILSGAAKEFLPKPQPQSLSRAVTIRQAAAPREIVYGRVRKGGTIVYARTFDNQNWIGLVSVAAGHGISAFGDLYLNGERAATVAQSDGAGIGRFHDGSLKLFYKRHLGQAGQSAAGLVAPEVTDEWTSDHRLEGCAAIWVQLFADFDIYTSGIPNITQVVDGRFVYDPRTDTTVWSDNPALCVANYMADPIYGLGAAIGAEDGINTASLIEAANICDELVPLNGGGTEKRYTLNGVISVDRAPKQNIAAMLTSMAGMCVKIGGQWHIRAGAYRVPTLTLTDEDIERSGIQVQLKRALSEQFNGVRGEFVSPDNDWQADDYPAIQSAVYLAEDQGIARWDDLTLPFTTSASTAQRLAKIRLFRHRRQITAVHNGRLTAWQAAVGETVNIQRSRYGWTPKPFEVAGLTLSFGRNEVKPQLTLAETAPAVYDWSATEEQVYAQAPSATLPSPWAIEPPGTVQISDDLYPTRPGLQPKVRMDVSWSASPSGFVRAYEVQIKGPGETNWQAAGRTDALTLSVFDVKPGSWDVRVRAVSALGVTSAWTTITSDVVGLAAPPAAIAGLTLQKAGGLAVLKWTLPTDPDVLVGGRVVIRHSNSATPSWANSYQMDEVAGNQTIAVVPLKPGTYLLKAEDSSQILSPVATVGTDGAQAVPFTSAATSLQAQTAWSGTKTNVEVNLSDQLTLIYLDDMIENPNDITNAEFLKNGVGATLTGGGTLPSGGAGTVLTPTATLGAHTVRVDKPVVEGERYRFSVVAKANGYNWIALNLFNSQFGDSNELVVNLSDGSISSNYFAPDDRSVTDLGDGWFKLEMLVGPALGSFANGGFEVRLLQDDTASFPDWTPDGTSGVILGDYSVRTEQAGSVGLYEFATGFDFTTVKTVRLRSDIDMAIENLSSTIDDRLDPIDTWADFDDTEGAQVDIVVEGRFTDDDPSGTPTWTDWTRVDSTEVKCRGAEFRARLSSESDDYNILLTGLSIHADEVV